jgi:putative tryptophan/tyrosine transport system substrate-binding protein
MKKSHLLPFAAAAVIAAALAVAWNRGDAPQEGLRVVAIATLVSHPALDSLQDNLKQELARQGFREGENIRFESRNASGQIQLVAGIANDLANVKPDVSVAITTPMAQAMAKVVRGPFVFAAVTDPVGAGIVKSLDAGAPLVTGATDAWPYNDQLKLIREIAPRAKRVVVIFNPGEAASQFGMKEIRRFAPALGLELVEGPVSNAAEVHSVAQSLSADADAIFLSSDSTAISGVAGAAKVAIKRKIPLFVGDSGTVQKGGIAAASIGYDKLGIEAGKLVARTLRGERGIKVISPDGSSDIVVNTKAAELMGVEIPASVLGRAKVYSSISE